MRERGHGDRGWLPGFLVLSAIWGASFLFIKVGDRAFAPLQVAFARCALGALALVAVLPGERPTRDRVLGLAVGFAGVVVVLGPWREIDGQLLGYLACLGAAACYGIGFPYARRFLAGRSESAVSLSAAQVLCGTAQLSLVVPWATGAPHRFPLDAILSMLALGAGGTGVAYVLNYDVIRRAGAHVASTVTYLVPPFSTVLGVARPGERPSWDHPAAGAGGPPRGGPTPGPRSPPSAR